MNGKTLGDYFREAMEIIGLNYCQIERFTGVPHDLVRRLEENSYNPRRLTFISIARLADFYGFSLRCIRETLEEEIHEDN